MHKLTNAEIKEIQLFIYEKDKHLLDKKVDLLKDVKMDDVDIEKKYEIDSVIEEVTQDVDIEKKYEVENIKQEDDNALEDVVIERLEDLNLKDVVKAVKISKTSSSLLNRAFKFISLADKRYIRVFNKTAVNLFIDVDGNNLRILSGLSSKIRVANNSILSVTSSKTRDFLGSTKVKLLDNVFIIEV